jgi:hypothetical protein
MSTADDHTQPRVYYDPDAINRLSGMALLRRWEGGEAFLARLDGLPCVYVNEAAMADFLPDGDADLPLSQVLQFCSERDRDAYLSANAWLQPRATPGPSG